MQPESTLSPTDEEMSEEKDERFKEFVCSVCGLDFSPMWIKLPEQPGSLKE